MIGHYSTPESLVCITPKCSSQTCLGGNIWSGSTIVDIKLYVSSVEGILTPAIAPKFYYYNYWTPAVYSISSSTWGTATTPLRIRSDNVALTSFDVVIADYYHGYLGSDGELNPESLPGNTNELEIFFRPPRDLAGGFYNLSFVVQDDFSHGSSSTGRAILFQNDRYDNTRFDRFYLFQSTLQGTSYSVCLYPSIESVSPALGSFGGGTILQIIGTGFTSKSSELVVYAGGLPCEVLASTSTTISCRTSETAEDYVSSRLFGSPGWWMRIWNEAYINNLHPTPDNAQLSFRWTKKFYFSLYDSYGYSWPTTLNANFPNNNRYIHDSATVFTAPYTAYYIFYIASDDYAYLYGSSEGIEVEEKLLAYNPSYSNEKRYYKNPKQQISSRIPLVKGEKLYLRFRNVVETLSLDYFYLGEYRRL